MKKYEDELRLQNKSQYTGTLKNSVCTRCNKSLNNKSRLEQDSHEKQCTQQSKLFEDSN